MWNLQVLQFLDVEKVVVVVQQLDSLWDGVGEGGLFQLFSFGDLCTLLQFVMVDDVLKIELFFFNIWEETEIYTSLNFGSFLNVRKDIVSFSYTCLRVDTVLQNISLISNVSKVIKVFGTPIILCFVQQLSFTCICDNLLIAA